MDKETEQKVNYYFEHYWNKPSNNKQLLMLVQGILSLL